MVADAEGDVSQPGSTVHDLKLKDHPEPASRWGQVDLQANWQLAAFGSLGVAFAQFVLGDPSGLETLASRMGGRRTRIAGPLNVCVEKGVVKNDRGRAGLLAQSLALAVRREERAVLSLEGRELLGGRRASAGALAYLLERGGAGLAGNHELALAPFLGDREIALQVTADPDMQLLLHA